MSDRAIIGSTDAVMVKPTMFGGQVNTDARCSELEGKEVHCPLSQSVKINPTIYPDKTKAAILSLKDMLAVQGADGNWNYCPYMHGMFNGMAYALSIMEDNEPQYRDAPKVWLCDATKNKTDLEKMSALLLSFGEEVTMYEIDEQTERRTTGIGFDKDGKFSPVGAFE